MAQTILLFLTDDHGAWALGAAGNDEIQTPHLDQLARAGVRFEHAYTPSPVCSPARACLLTGKTPSQVGIHDWLEERDTTITERDWLDGVPTLFEYFQQAGYRTALSGKWHLGRSHLPPLGADDHFGLPGWQGEHNQDYTYVLNGERVLLPGNKSAHITDHALRFIDRTPADQPLFLCVGYIATHSPYQQQKHRPDLTALYQAADFKAIPSYDPHPWVKNEGTANDPSASELRDRSIGYYAAVTELDENIGRVLDHLRSVGRYDETTVIYTSDHGCALGHHGFFGKGNSTRPLNMYEISLQIPLIWAGPGIEAGLERPEFVDHYDTFRTILDRAGIAQPAAESHAGRSYLPLLAGESIAWDNTHYGEYGDLRMIRNERWKLVWRYPNGPHDLFDLQTDPGEIHNLYGQAGTEGVTAQLKESLDQFYARYSDDQKSGLRVKELPQHNLSSEAWRDGRREARGLQIDT